MRQLFLCLEILLLKIESFFWFFHFETLLFIINAFFELKPLNIWAQLLFVMVDYNKR